MNVDGRQISQNPKKEQLLKAGIVPNLLLSTASVAKMYPLQVQGGHN